MSERDQLKEAVSRVFLNRTDLGNITVLNSSAKSIVKIPGGTELEVRKIRLGKCFNREESFILAALIKCK